MTVLFKNVVYTKVSSTKRIFFASFFNVSVENSKFKFHEFIPRRLLLANVNETSLSLIT